jgi:hypothetical protein
MHLICVPTRPYQGGYLCNNAVGLYSPGDWVESRPGSWARVTRQRPLPAVLFPIHYSPIIYHPTLHSTDKENVLTQIGRMIRKLGSVQCLNVAVDPVTPSRLGPAQDHTEVRTRPQFAEMLEANSNYYTTLPLRMRVAWIVRNPLP